jgi:hypothetical protein
VIQPAAADGIQEAKGCPAIRRISPCSQATISFADDH